MPAKCWDCGETGHVVADCPNQAIAASDGRPPWCGFCDERTRQVDHGRSASRCQECHPQRRQQLRQHRRCPRCHVAVYEWDNGECGSHSGPGMPDKRPGREHIDAIVRAKGTQ